MKRFAQNLLLLLLLPLLIHAQEKVDLEMIYKIKQEGLKKSQIENISFYLTDYSGARLTGSEGIQRAREWIVGEMKEFGLENVRIESFGEFGKGWNNRKSYVALVSPYYQPFIGTPKAWTPGTDGLQKAEVVLIRIDEESDIEQYKGKLAGKIVTTDDISEYEVSFDPLAKRYTNEELEERAMASSPRQRGDWNEADIARWRKRRQLGNLTRDFFREEGVLAVLTGSGQFGTVRSSGSSYKVDDDSGVPEMLLTTEHHGRIVRLLQHDVKVEVEIEIDNEFNTNDTNGYNVIGEIPGTNKELKNEVVMIGAHLDSWLGGTGAADNASGCIVMMEAMRILKAIGVELKRTVKIGLWGGEEQGLYGSRGYVRDYLGDRQTMELKPGHKKFSAYYNVDNGTGKIRGIYLQENDMVRPVFEAWFEPFKDMGASTISIRRTGGTDHLSYDAVGLPGFQFIQDPIEYGRGYHTNMDTYERLLMNDMKHNAVIVAALVYHTAMRENLLTRKPLPEPQGER